MKNKPLQVALHVEEPTRVALTVRDTVQLDRLIETPDGVDAERHGALLTPGVHEVSLAPGDYAFRTLEDAELQVVLGGVTTNVTTLEDKDPWPDPRIFVTRGDVPDGETPRFTVR